MFLLLPGSSLCFSCVLWSLGSLLVGANQTQGGGVCKKFSLPTDGAELTREVDALLLRRAAESHEEGSSFLCEGVQDGFQAELTALEGVVSALREDTRRILGERETERGEREKQAKETQYFKGIVNKKLDALTKMIITNGPRDCWDLRVDGKTKSAVYKIYPSRYTCDEPKAVLCDMEKDRGGWTVILNRQLQHQPLNFFQNWQAYKWGFGLPNMEHWLGNEILHLLTKDRNYVLRLEAIDYAGNRIEGEWKTFKVASEANKYRLTVKDYNQASTASNNQMAAHNGAFFSTFDQDNDQLRNMSCASQKKGGYWYTNCYRAHLTGVYGVVRDQTGILFHQTWNKTDNAIHYAKRLLLKIRPRLSG